MCNTFLMLILHWVGVALTGAVWDLAIAAQPDPGKRQLALRDYFVVEIANPEPLAAEHGWRLEEPFPIKDHWLLSAPKIEGSKGRINKRQLVEARDIYGAKHIYDEGLSRLQKSSQKNSRQQNNGKSKRKDKPETIEDIEKEFQIEDPLFPDQWHIYNPRELGHDMNVLPVWRRNITGRGVTVAIVDDGLDFEHPDFAHSFSLRGSWDYNLHQQEPRPLLSDDTHGTRCAGEIAAGFDQFCGVGIAPGAQVAGIRILSGTLTKADEARSLIHQSQINDIYSCSWGPQDDGMKIEGPSPIVRRAELEGIENGRNGKGSVYVVASGNGDLYGDNCNYDGYTNSIYSITVGAIDRLNQHPFYAESCSANLVVTYSSNHLDKITTTDRRNPLEPDVAKCTNQHSGTSAAAPIAAAVFALVLEQRPDLTWRDLQYLVRDTAKKFEIVTNDRTTEPQNRVTNDWQETADGHWYHNSYGYGLLDADAIVSRAADWELVKPQTFYFLPENTERATITPSTELSTKVSADQWAEANMDHIEHVRVRVSYSHEQRGHLKFQLTSPSGLVSDLALPRGRDLSAVPVHEWEFLSVLHWNETGEGEWKLRVSGPDEQHGVVENWQLKFFGQVKDSTKAKRYSDFWEEYEPKAAIVHDALFNEDEQHEDNQHENDNDHGDHKGDFIGSGQNNNYDDDQNGSNDSNDNGNNDNNDNNRNDGAFSQAVPPAKPVETTNAPLPDPPVIAPTSDVGTPPKPLPGNGSHSLWYYLFASIGGVIVLAVIFVPIVYYCYYHRIRNYGRLRNQDIELDDAAEFEIDADSEGSDFEAVD